MDTETKTQVGVTIGFGILGVILYVVSLTSGNVILNVLAVLMIVAVTSLGWLAHFIHELKQMIALEESDKVS